MGALAVAALGLVEAISIAREIARQSGEQLDVNQELIGQGMANIAAGIFSGYASSGSFTRSAVNFQTGARSQMSSVFCGLFILAGVLAFGPLAAYLPRASLAGLIMLIAYRMVDWRGVRRVMRGSRSETGIMVSTFVATLVLPLEFAVLAGVILSLAIYIYKSSMPTVESVVPDANFHQFVVRPRRSRFARNSGSSKSRVRCSSERRPTSRTPSWPTSRRTPGRPRCCCGCTESTDATSRESTFRRGS